MNLNWVKALICATRYLLWLLEHVIKYMTKNAYIQIVLTSKSFFPSAWNAFALMIKHAHRYGFGNAIGTVFIFFGTILITAGVTAIAYLAGDNFAPYFLMTSPIPTTVVCGIIALAIAYVFMSIFSFSSDAILQSFLLDEETGFRGTSRP